MSAPDVQVVDNPEKHRYEARDADGAVLGFSAYRPAGDTLVITHTEVDDAQEGKGVGSVLVRGVLDDIRSSGRTVDPVCPFVGGYIERHPEYGDLVAR